MRIYFALDRKGNILHSSVVIPRNFKYPLLNESELIIGPCITKSEVRGKGIYPLVLNQIAEQEKDWTLLMIIKKDNIASIHGVQKAGFDICKERVTGTRLLHRFVYVR